MTLRKSLSAIDKLLVTADRFFKFYLIDSDNFLFLAISVLECLKYPCLQLGILIIIQTNFRDLIAETALVFGFGRGLAKGKWALANHNEHSFARDFFRDSGCHCAAQFGFQIDLI